MECQGAALAGVSSLLAGGGNCSAGIIRGTCGIFPLAVGN